MHDIATITWTEGGQLHRAHWQSAGGVMAPRRVVVADDTMKADVAYRLAAEGAALLWRGDYQNARQLLQALARRVDGKRAQSGKKASAASQASDPAASFYRHRQALGQRARILGMLLVPLDAGYMIPLRRAPDVRAACIEAWGEGDEPVVVSLRELLGIIGAHEWRKKGVEVPSLGARIHPYYGVFSPVRGEYVDLVAGAPWPHGQAPELAFEIGAGTGVLAALLAKRGANKIVATDCDARALACARDNVARLGFTDRIDIIEADLFPAGRAPLVVCNPPWVPAKPSSAIEQAVYDPDSRMLRGFLSGLSAHLAPGGEGWLILSDLAEHLGLRTREQLLGWIAAAGLQVAGRLDARPRHPKASDATDPLHAARAAEVTSLWRLRVS